MCLIDSDRDCVLTAQNTKYFTTYPKMLEEFEAFVTIFFFLQRSKLHTQLHLKTSQDFSTCQQ